MKVGDYVRYVDVFNNIIKIRKINKIIPPDKLIKKDVYFFNNKECSLKENIIKPSPNIIDLIELGDLVKIEFEKDDTNVFEVVAIDKNNNEIGIFNNNFEFDWVGIEQLKSIVTKEQFESMEYRL